MAVRDQPSQNLPDAWWSIDAAELLARLGTDTGGLASAEAAARLERYGPNDVSHLQAPRLYRMMLARFSNPFVLILLFAALVSTLLREWFDALVVAVIVVASAAISVFQERRASNAVAALRKRITIRSTVLRDDQPQRVPASELVPGDVVLLSAGNLVPADGAILESKDLFANQSVMSGETFPAAKRPGRADAQALLAQRNNCVFMGTSVSSGTGRMLVVRTGLATEFGAVAQSLARRDEETDFERGLRHFGILLMRLMVLMVLAVLAVNVLHERATAQTLLFAMALAVGLAPELLPAVLAVTLSQGSQKMAALGVIVKRLNAIENLGSMTVLCTDKTGTLTQGVVRLDGAFTPAGDADEAVRLLAYLNASLQSGLQNTLDDAIIAAAGDEAARAAPYRKLDEIPYDFQRKRLGIVVAGPGAAPLLVVKGALANVLDVCERVAEGAGDAPLDEAAREDIDRRFAQWSAQGFRVLGLATRDCAPKTHYGREDEQAMTFRGFLLFFDPPEPGVATTLDELEGLGVGLKIITGDNLAVATHVAEAVGITVTEPLTGEELARMTDEALWYRAPRCNLFAQVDPHQKERIVRALQKSGEVVGFLGDGINDAPALHAADAGISVDRAVDVAKDAADFVLLEHDLNLIREGIDEGRHTFANTLKYVFITTSANFGNMLSMAAAALFLPFLPLLAKQILLNNFLSDIPALGIASDNVDREWDRTPHRWNLAMIRSFMFSFGLISTAFDLLTFAALLWLVGESPALFRTGWFVESLLTELLILLVIRTSKPFIQSRPSRFLVVAIGLVSALTIALPYLPMAGIFDFVPLPPLVMSTILAITFLYLLVSEATKMRFYRRFGFGPA